MQDEAGSRLVALTVHVHDPVVMAGFWAHALRWELGIGGADGIPLVPTDETSFTVRFVADPIERRGMNRQHLDLTTSSLDDQRESVAQLLALGATHLDIGQRPEEGHVVLADPEGNELCLIGPDNRFLAGCPRLGAISGDGTRQVGYFWSAALGWPLVWDQDEETAIRAPDGTGPKITWGGPPVAPKLGRNRLHLDLVTNDGVDREAEIARLVALGATRVADVPSDGSVAMLDPDANEFTLLAPR